VTWWRRRLVIGPLAVVVFMALAVYAARRPGDRALFPPPPGARSIAVAVVSHGYHAGLIVSREALLRVADEEGLVALTSIANSFERYASLEIGWGDEGFYRNVPHISDLRFVEAARALLLPGNRSVLHIVGLSAPARTSFPASDVVDVTLSVEGFRRLARRLDASFAREGGAIIDMGPGLYGPSTFYRAEGTFHIFSACNHWLAGLLDAAGVPTNPLLATLPQGLLTDLDWRSGLRGY
jgi:uncharacterized protein (TIGR02117 family)